MHSLATETDVRAMHVAVEEARLVVDLMDGRTIAVPLAWYPRLANATPEQRSRALKDTHVSEHNARCLVDSCPWHARRALPPPNFGCMTWPLRAVWASLRMSLAKFNAWKKPMKLN